MRRTRDPARAVCAWHRQNWINGSSRYVTTVRMCRRIDIATLGHAFWLKSIYELCEHGQIFHKYFSKHFRDTSSDLCRTLKILAHHIGLLDEDDDVAAQVRNLRMYHPERKPETSAFCL